MNANSIDVPAIKEVEILISPEKQSVVVRVDGAVQLRINMEPDTPVIIVQHNKAIR